MFLCVSLFCRGFGFVTFADAASVDKVLAQPHHELDSKTVCLCFDVICNDILLSVLHVLKYESLPLFISLSCLRYDTVIIL